MTHPTVTYKKSFIAGSSYSFNTTERSKHYERVVYLKWGFEDSTTLPTIKVFNICDLSSNAKYLTAFSRSEQVYFAFLNKLNWNFYSPKFDPSKKVDP